MTRRQASVFLRIQRTLGTRLVRLAGGSALAFLGLYGTSAWADVIYSYTGNPFTQVSGSPYTTSDYVTVSMTLPNAIAPSQTDLVVTSQLISLTMSDGVQTIDLFIPNLIAGDTFAKFTTDSQGNITAWNVDLAVSDVPNNDQINTFLNQDAGVNDIAEIGNNLGAPAGAWGQNSNLPGTWSVVPEPNTAALLATGLVGLFALGSPRRRSGLGREGAVSDTHSRAADRLATEAEIVLEPMRLHLVLEPTSGNRRRSGLRPIACGLAALAALLLSASASAVNIDWVQVGNPGNAPDTSTNCLGPTGSGSSTCGSVGNTYYISKYDTTNAQYAEFLNAVDPSGSNTLALWNLNMQTDTSNGGISFVSGNASGS
ncbi:MAG TPA: PEP-CTERM sorting domain-containing protein, partial [Myxococcota bacterium]|nr:PEP-CTERM sorting domain-containing protein [Myxococcota bacterium]